MRRILLKSKIHRATVTEADGAVWGDDDLAIFLDPGPSRSVYYQFEINALGAVMIVLTVATPLLAGYLSRKFSKVKP